MSQPHLSELEAQLLPQFQGLFARAGGQPPCWARRLDDGSLIPPVLPLVGRRYTCERGLLVYASAENLSWMLKEASLGSPRWASFVSPERAWTRYRDQYENPCLQDDSPESFPDVGIQPVSDGGLLCAALMLWTHLGYPQPDSPCSLLEQIAVTNWCKFVVDSPVNKDYAGSLKKLRESLPYVKAELGALKPRVVLLPKVIWRRQSIQEAMHEASPGTRFVGAWQFNARVVNTRLARLEEEGQELRERYSGSLLASWMQRIRRIPQGNAWRYVAHLERALAHCVG
jgi:hypothetical protein